MSQLTEAMKSETRTLHAALAQHGITHTAYRVAGKRELHKDGVSLGAFDVMEGWRFLHALEGKQ